MKPLDLYHLKFESLLILISKYVYSIANQAFPSLSFLVLRFSWVWYRGGFASKRLIPFPSPSLPNDQALPKQNHVGYIPRLSFNSDLKVEWYLPPFPLPPFFPPPFPHSSLPFPARQGDSSLLSPLWRCAKYNRMLGG